MQGVEFYEDNADDMMIENFVIKHRPLVKKIALYIKRRLPQHIEFDDLLQSGLVGLLEARTHYKPDMGASFETFASLRIRGAMVDSLRKNSWVSRETIKNMRKISDAIVKIEQRNQRPATTEDIVAELGISAEEHLKISQEISICHMVSLDEIDRDQSHFGSDENDPREINQREGLQQRLRDIIETMPERDKQVLSLYYIDEFTFKQIGEILELTEARICQIHSQAIEKMRAKMKIEDIC